MYKPIGVWLISKMKFNNNNNLKQINRFHFLNKTDMKQIFFVMSILLTLQLSAQTLKVPKFTKIVKVVAKDVNLREAPSASSPRLIRSVGEGGEYSIVWSKATLRGDDEVIRAEALPVVGEAGDWYKAIHNCHSFVEKSKYYLVVLTNVTFVPAFAIP